MSWRHRHLDEGPFQDGLVAWLLDSPRRFREPVPGRGSLRLFVPDQSVSDALLDQERWAINMPAMPAAKQPG